MGGKSNHVYLYMDQKQVIRYVGRGTVLRAQDHGVLDSNPDFRQAWIDADGNLTVAACSFNNDDEAAAVEAALIQVLRDFPQAHLTNRRLDKYRFTPLGVPPELWMRGTEPSLARRELAHAVGGPLVAIYLGPGQLTDELRSVLDPLKPEASAIADRTLRSWALGSAAELWKSNASTRPAAIIAITGSMQRRYVIASVDLRDFDFESIVTRDQKGNLVSLIEFAKSGFIKSPDSDADLDAFELRGRLVDNIKFSRAPQTRRWLDTTGREHSHSPFRQWAEKSGPVKSRITAADME